MSGSWSFDLDECLSNTHLSAGPRAPSHGPDHAQIRRADMVDVYTITTASVRRLVGQPGSVPSRPQAPDADEEGLPVLGKKEDDDASDDESIGGFIQCVSVEYSDTSGARFQMLAVHVPNQDARVDRFLATHQAFEAYAEDQRKKGISVTCYAGDTNYPEPMAAHSLPSIGGQFEDGSTLDARGSAAANDTYFMQSVALSGSRAGSRVLQPSVLNYGRRFVKNGPGIDHPSFNNYTAHAFPVKHLSAQVLHQLDVPAVAAAPAAVTVEADLPDDEMVGDEAAVRPSPPSKPKPVHPRDAPEDENDLAEDDSEATVGADGAKRRKGSPKDGSTQGPARHDV
ncbi:MAG: hypothetical protein U0Q15_08100 [Kineosporiaceae bacterium]